MHFEFFLPHHEDHPSALAERLHTILLGRKAALLSSSFTFVCFDHPTDPPDRGVVVRLTRGVVLGEGGGCCSIGGGGGVVQFCSRNGFRRLI